ncbi:hypothetical protein GW846_00020 [Candidatus Gracilibacteria bacterium]|nr:hypothetical protein [Candidatus Gracilibacteria bacterium]
MILEELKNNEILRKEFEDLIFSDKNFNYDANEFEEWLIDLVIPHLND